MRENVDTILRLTNSSISLVPYTKAHVPRYHSWMGDEELRRLTCSERLSLTEEYENQTSWREDEKKLTFIILHDCQMVGDVNLYLNNDEYAEIEVMIADKSHRRKGLARDALNLMMCYANCFVDVHVFVAKILADNSPSVRLFEKLGFKLLRKLEVFGEVHLVKDVSVDNAHLLDTKNSWIVGKYSDNEASKMEYPIE